jgi:transposase InsO family protein
MRAEMVKEALERAYKSRDAGEYVIVHSDRGAQYASDYLDSKKAIRSMSRKGNCWDNSIMESFFGRFKTEYIFWEKYATHEEARRKIFEWIEIEHNRKRARTALGNVSPVQFERTKWQKQSSKVCVVHFSGDHQSATSLRSTGF